MSGAGTEQTGMGITAGPGAAVDVPFLHEARSNTWRVRLVEVLHLMTSLALAVFYLVPAALLVTSATWLGLRLYVPLGGFGLEPAPGHLLVDIVLFMVLFPVMATTLARLACYTQRSRMANVFGIVETRPLDPLAGSHPWARGLYASSSKESGRFRWGPWMLLGGVLVVVLVVLTAVPVLGNVVAHQNDKTDSFGGASTLSVDNNTGGRIEVGAAEGDEIVVERTLRGGPLSDPQDWIHENGDRLVIEGRCGGSRLFSTCSIDYAIQVPEDVAVTLDTSSGAVEVRDLASELSVNSVSGSIEVFGHEGPVEVEAALSDISLADIIGSVRASNVSGDIEAGGEGERLEVSTASGSVDAEDFTAEEVVAESVSGSLELGGGFTTLEASTTSGGVEITTDTPFELTEVETVSGGVQASVPAGDYDIGGESTSGDREFDVDTSSEADSRIEVNTTSGSVRVGR